MKLPVIDLAGSFFYGVHEHLNHGAEGSGRTAVLSYRADDDLGWRPVSQIYPKPEPGWRLLLLDAGSLTQRLISLSNGQFNVEVMNESWVRHRSPALLACFDAHVASQAMWSRQVVLKGCGAAWVTAHSLIPFSSLQGPLQRLTRLQNKPLGAFLFRHPTLQRRQFEVARLEQGWGRRSLFYLYGKPLLVAEFFLPAVKQAVAQANPRTSHEQR